MSTLIAERPTHRRPTNRLWGIVLAGRGDEGRGTSAGSRAGVPDKTLFRQTLDRAARLIPEERLVAVLARGHGAYYDSALAALPGVHRVVQPAYRGSGPEVYLAVLRIALQDPEALVVVLPSHHGIDREARFMAHVSRAVQAVMVRPELPIVIGAPPAGPEARRSWIEPGELVEGLEAYPVRTVQRFLPRPTPAEAAALWAGEGLINTRVIIASVRALLSLGDRYLPDVLETFEPLGPVFGAPEEALMCEAVYEEMPYASINHALFVRAHEVAVLPMSDVTLRRRPVPAELELEPELLAS
jgi:mannose-1-phosphate guanylyltransferase